MLIYSLRPPWIGQTIERKALLRFVESRYRLAVNQPARITAQIVPSADVALGDLVQIVRDDLIEAEGVVTEIGSNGLTTQIEAEGLLSVLGWRYVAYRAGVAGRSTFSALPAETLAKQVLSTNFGPQAVTSQGRLLDGYAPWLGIEADSGRGPTLPSRGCAWRNVLDEVVELAELSSVDIGCEISGSIIYVKWLPRPTPPTATHVFGPEYGNVDSYELRRIAHRASHVVAAGQGEEGARQIAIASSAAIPQREYVRHATWDGADLGREAQDALRESRERLEVRWRLAQTVGSRYWRDYRLGDYVRVQVEDYSAIHRITAVSAVMSGAREDIELETVAVG